MFLTAKNVKTQEVVYEDVPVLMATTSMHKGRMVITVSDTPMSAVNFDPTEYHVVLRADKRELSEEDDSHLMFLRQTLIPDLRESGMDATADDFERCIGIINHLIGKE